MRTTWKVGIGVRLGFSIIIIFNQAHTFDQVHYSSSRQGGSNSILSTLTALHSSKIKKVCNAYAY